MILKYVGLSVLSTLIPKIADEISDALSDAYDNVFGSEEVCTPVEPKKSRKRHDTTKITQHQASFIRNYHENFDGTGHEHAKHLNEEFGLNKSTSFYARIWSKNFDVNSLKEVGGARL